MPISLRKKSLFHLFILSIQLGFLCLKAEADGGAVTPNDIKKLGIGIGSVIIEFPPHESERIHAFKITAIKPSVNVNNPDYSSTFVLKEDLAIGKPDEIISQPCVYTFPNGQTMANLSAGYHFLYDKKTKQYSSLALLLGQRVDWYGRSSFKVDDKIHRKISSCAQKTEKELLLENQSALDEKNRIFCPME